MSEKSPVQGSHLFERATHPSEAPVPDKEYLLPDDLEDSYLDPNNSERLPWAATPALPWRTRVKLEDGSELSYSDYARDAIFQRYYKNLLKLPTHPHRSVTDMAYRAMQAALSKRLTQNDWMRVPKELIDNPTFVASRKGEASPESLIALLMEYPDLGSLELGKLTAPFNWEIMTELDVAIGEALRYFRASEPAGESRYYLTRIDDHEKPRATVIVRKQPIASIHELEVIQRDSIVVDLKESDTQSLLCLLRDPKAAKKFLSSEINDRIKLPNDIDITMFIEGQLELPISERSTAINPVVRSYYATNNKSTPETRAVYRSK